MTELTDEMIARVPGIYLAKTWHAFDGSVWFCTLNRFHGSGHTRTAAIVSAFSEWYRRQHGITDFDLSAHIPEMVATIRGCQPQEATT